MLLVQRIPFVEGVFASFRDVFRCVCFDPGRAFSAFALLWCADSMHLPLRGVDSVHSVRFGECFSVVCFDLVVEAVLCSAVAAQRVLGR